MTSRFGTALRRWSLATGAVAALAPCIAGATLGAPAASTATDAQTLKASVKSSDRNAYHVDELQLPSGTLLREYSTAGGVVFAVAWSGPAIPDLRDILGKYFDTYTAAARVSRTGHHHLEVRQDEFVMQSSGHMRAFTGRAYLPQAVPAGVALDELR